MDEFKELLAGKEFDADELELLSYLLEEEGVEHDAAAMAAPRILPRAGDAQLPLSFAQQRLWFLAQLQPTSAAYNMPGLLRLAGRLDLAALTQSLAEVVRRHEALRTTFHVVGGEPVQRIAAAECVELLVEDLTHLTGARQTEEVQQRALAEARRPFDLTKGPLVRARLLRLAATEHVLLVTMHHIVSDGWSIGIFIRELATIYAALVHDRPAPLADLPIQYADYAIWQRQWLTGPVLDEQLAYWRARLAGDLPVLQLPT
ncbi:MAG TPA: condensation domain-containing protein, partial [Pyrinomonadaceae bacterium]|nr:condensation domain-containing protein [Pyrinomonadaceae bacterium]